MTVDLKPVQLWHKESLFDLNTDSLFIQYTAEMGVEKLAHPYFPRDLHLPHYKPNEKEILELLVPFFGFVAVVTGLTWLYTGKVYYFKDVLNV